jgi:hypothetical protein
MLKFSYARAVWILRLSAAIAALSAAVIVAPSSAQAQVSLFGGYSYLHASMPVGRFGGPPFSHDANLASGWEISGSYSIAPFIGAVADFGGNYGKLYGSTARVHTYMVGPQLSLPGRISPFAHVLIGAAHEQQDTIADGVHFALGSDTSFATAIGGGIDLKPVPFIGVRLIQVDYLHTNWHGMSQGQPRISAGVVLHF